MRKNGPSVDKKESQLNIMTWLLRFEGEKGGAGPFPQDAIQSKHHFSEGILLDRKTGCKGTE
jgi:hypothetical protein